ncbi:MAG: glucose-6-phosphate dehydrogenase [Thermus sp.]|uniref:glucose-6-phosphate dehydrogenase n=1 Tax=Thermus sp. TaxID=275 RepID=UPI003D12F3A6
MKFVILGFTGDLTRRLLLPALLRLLARGEVGDLEVLGLGREASDESEVLERLEAFLKALPGTDLKAWAALRRRTRYLRAELTPEGLRGLRGLEGDAVFYLALPPALFAKAAEALGALGLAEEKTGFRRLVVEKPFGKDLASARELNAALHRHFREDQIYRMDHFLGKWAAENLLATRFGNRFLEPIWRSCHVDWVEITYAETLGLEGRAAYYDGAGALRDMLQNHLMQLFALAAMEPPARLSPGSLRARKLEALRAVRPIPEGARGFAARGQYRGYREEEGVSRESRTETFAALKLYLDDWRFQGVPFYLRSGKRLARDAGYVALALRAAPQGCFGEAGRGYLVFWLSPEVGLDLTLFGRALAGEGLEAHTLRFRPERPPERTAYEEALLAVFRGDLGHFPSEEEVEAAWAIVDPVLRAWQEGEPEVYPEGSEGPASAWGILEPGHAWLPLGGEG